MMRYNYKTYFTAGYSISNSLWREFHERQSAPSARYLLQKNRTVSGLGVLERSDERTGGK